MSRKLFQRFTPSPELIREHRSLRFLGKWLHDPNLFHLNRYSASSAVFIGFLVAFIPLPIHTLVAAAAAIWWRANLPISLAAVWISNPFTIPPQFYVAYRLGARLLQQQPQHLHFELSLRWFSMEFHAVWQPLLLGCLVCGLIAGVFGAGIVRLLWRIQVALRWRARQQRQLHR
jgi:uncharacterized protein (DUF2062 family)